MWPKFRRRRPLVSLILCTKNAMPYLTEAVESVRRVTYEPFELVIQDCVSTDGTAEFLSELDGLAGVSFVSEPDRGIGDGFNRALRRCRGDVIGSIDADNLLEPHALGVAVSALADPAVAAVYGAVVVVDEAGAPLTTFVSGAFDRRAVMRCEIVPPFSTSFFSRRACGTDLRFDDSLATCADYDLWLRLSDRRIASIPDAIGRTRLGPSSMSQQADRFEQFCADKVSALEAYVVRTPELRGELEDAKAGIYAWAAESVHALEGPSPLFASFVERATMRDAQTERSRRLLELSAA
jgi:glycosyltransferase involved in cell wall biosynthesis